MENAFEHIDALIAKLLAGEASPEEAARLNAWRKEASGNETYFEENKKLMEAVHAAVDTDAAWKRLDERISQNQGRIISLYRRPVFLRSAAAVLLIATLGIIANWFLTQRGAEPTHFMAAKDPVQKVLPDGSKVFINKNSELSYAADKDGQRNVTLTGEAFFEVVHDEKKPFVIHTGGLLIRDIGTAFNVKAIPGNPGVEVSVESGEVQFYSAANAGVTLKQGEKAVYHLASARFSKSTLDPSENTLSYKTRSCEFKEAPLTEVIDQLNDVYNSRIRLKDQSLAIERVSVSFHNESLDMILNILSETLDLEAEKTDSVIFLKRKAGSN